jgi:hypothetical protein
MNKQTAVQFLIDQLIKYEVIDKTTHPENVLFSKALKMEREQIEEAWKDNREYVYYDSDKDELSENTKSQLASEYFTQTFKNENKLL